jgi:hypothetical protein
VSNSHDGLPSRSDALIAFRRVESVLRSRSTESKASACSGR